MKSFDKGATLDPADVRLDTLHRMTAVDSARARIALAVKLGLMAPGERLPDVSAIAAAFEMGEVTVRRALTSLAQDGLLVRSRGRNGGTWVADHPPIAAATSIEDLQAAREEIVRLIDLRLTLESGLVQLAVDRLPESAHDELADLIDLMAASTEWAQFHTLDTQFHRRIAELAGAPAGLSEYSRVVGTLYAYYLPYPMAHLHGSNEEHRELLSAMVDRDHARAHEVVVRHVDVLRHTMFIGLS